MALVSRTHAGLRLAHVLTAYASRSDVTVVAVNSELEPLALATAKALRVPGDYYGVSPILISGARPQLVGAVAAGGAVVLDERAVEARAIPTALV